LATCGETDCVGFGECSSPSSSSSMSSNSVCRSKSSGLEQAQSHRHKGNFPTMISPACPEKGGRGERELALERPLPPCSRAPPFFFCSEGGGQGEGEVGLTAANPSSCDCEGVEWVGIVATPAKTSRTARVCRGGAHGRRAASRRRGIEGEDPGGAVPAIRSGGGGRRRSEPWVAAASQGRERGLERGHLRAGEMREKEWKRGSV
jgi:hypothetical protein